MDKLTENGTNMENPPLDRPDRWYLPVLRRNYLLICAPIFQAPACWPTIRSAIHQNYRQVYRPTGILTFGSANVQRVEGRGIRPTLVGGCTLPNVSQEKSNTTALSKILAGGALGYRITHLRYCISVTLARPRISAVLYYLRYCIP